MKKLEDMSNELLLCVWDRLLAADIIYSFSNLNIRIHQLLVKFCGLYKELNLRYCSLSAFRFFCYQLPMMNEWRLNLSVLKLGNRYRCCQIDSFANEIVKSFVIRYLARQGKSYDNPSKDLFRLIISNKKPVEPIFPQLTYLSIFQGTSIDEDCRDILLYVAAGGTTMNTFTWRSCSNQTHHAKAFFDWLFRCSINLHSFRLENPFGENGFELTYEHTVLNVYRPHQSLTSLTINILNFSTLDILLHYLLKLEYLDVHISKPIEAADITDQRLPRNLNYPKELRTLKLRYLNVRGKGYYRFEQLAEKFSETLEHFSLSIYHYCRGEPYLNYNGTRLSILCQKLLHLRSLHFAIQVQLCEKSNNQTLTEFTRTFRIPFWFDGPFGRKRVCVDFHQLYNIVQMFSLPYTFNGIALIRTINLIDMQFNTSEEEEKVPINLSLALESLWCGMDHIYICLAEKQKVPLPFFQALQCPRSQGKTLAILPKRGIIPDNVEGNVQLTHFNILELNNPIDANSAYNLEELCSWLRLLPNIKCLDVYLTELKYWLNNNANNPHLDSFLRRVERLYVECSDVINAKMNEEIMEPLLLFLIDKHRFPQLRCLRFMNCKNISSAWDNIEHWIDFILNRISEHQLACVRFDFIEKEQEITDLHTGDQTIAITGLPYIINIHRFVKENHVALWLERKHKQFF
ncbi:unnamed protein product [Rotaria magnacalcarata]|uniref:F-box domain-containing protein n=3 Tax=Rotaria magnacalcarata TaxID=392030 RepID=A0A816S6E2_9BILA|nr:unnamed protein product [Rotaria magnacalcarata]